MFAMDLYTHAPVSTLCSAEITFKTDPKNTDYAAEHGASRNFEPWREEEAVEQEDRLAKMEEEENNPMKALENRTVDSKREMDVLDALQDIRARNARNERVGHSVDLLANIGIEELENEEDRERKRLEEEDEKLVREVFCEGVHARQTWTPCIRFWFWVNRTTGYRACHCDSEAKGGRCRAIPSQLTVGVCPRPYCDQSLCTSTGQEEED